MLMSEPDAEVSDTTKMNSDQKLETKNLKSSLRIAMIPGQKIDQQYGNQKRKSSKSRVF